MKLATACAPADPLGQGLAEVRAHAPGLFALYEG